MLRFSRKIYIQCTYDFTNIISLTTDNNRPLGRPRRRWVDNIRMDLVEVGWGDVDWIGLAQGLVNSVLNLQVP
jgi:hypothetical protein